MSNAQWHEDQAIGERALREHARRQADLTTDNERLRAALRGVLPMAEVWFRREFDGMCDHEPGECTCDREAQAREAIRVASLALRGGA
jgi:hypothetical protein